jgi:hypothetical protein
MRFACVALLLVACSRGEPPTYSSPGFSESVSPIPKGLEDASVADVADAAQPEDSGALAQTHDRPVPEGALFDSRVAGLWDAIVRDEPDRGMPFFFPLAAYVQVKAIVDPAGDFKHRLAYSFARDIHAAHDKLGAHAADAVLIGLDVPMNRARWIEPNEEGNKVGYFRVYVSKLRYSVGAKKLSIDVTSLISWRGEWYVVHLSGFK